MSLHKNLAAQQQQNDTLKFQVSRLQALANIGVSTCMIAHEINNLLTPTANYARLALDNPDDAKLLDKALQKTVRNCERATRMMQSMLAVAGGESEQKEATPLRSLVEDIFGCLCRDFGKDGITVEVDIADNVEVWGIPIQIQQVLMNLILNAREAMLPRGGVLRINAHEVEGQVLIEVADTGCGIDRDNLDKIFEPFFTTKADEESDSFDGGFGLGLAFCHKIVTQSGGSISVESQIDKGTMFRVSLPCQAAIGQSEQQAAPQPDPE